MSAPASARPVEDRFCLAGTLLDGRIRIDRVVARGGFGVVYQGIHEGLGVPVALKVLHIPDQYSDGVREEFHRSFVQEARLVYQLAHPAIVRLLDHGISPMPTGEVVPWMVLEWLDGVTLARVLREGRAGLAPAAAVALLRPVLEALAMVHARGVAHRDITPANIFLCDGPAGPAARLIDFGVARVMEAQESPASGHTATQSAFTAFSKAYAAPEQLGHTRTGPWTDVHALALVLSEMITLRRPFEGSDAAEMLVAAMSPTRPTPAAKGVDAGAFEPVLARALSLRPAERFAHAGELLAALDLAARAPPAPPPRPAPAGPSTTRWIATAVLIGGALGVAIALARPPRAVASAAAVDARPTAPPAPPPAAEATDIPVRQPLAPEALAPIVALPPRAAREHHARASSRHLADAPSDAPPEAPPAARARPPSAEPARAFPPNPFRPDESP